MAKVMYKLYLSIILIGFISVSCCKDKTIMKNEIRGEHIAKPIVYDLIIKNPDPEDVWKDECLANTNIEPMIKGILEAVKSGKLTAYNYYDNSELAKHELDSILKVGELDKNTGKILFKENWYWDNENLELHKIVEEIMFAYQVYASNGDLRGYKASFLVKLNTEK